MEKKESITVVLKENTDKEYEISDGDMEKIDQKLIDFDKLD